MSRLPAPAALATQRAVARPVSHPLDPAEREADRAADVVVGGGNVTGWSLSAAPPRHHDAAGVQRQETDSDKEEKEPAEDPNAKEYKEAARKTGPALLETKAGKALKKQILDSPEVAKLKDFATSPAGIAIGATAIAGGVAGLAVTGKKLPFQPPAIPLDRITPGLSAQVNYKGPVNAPTFVGLTITFKPKKKESARDKAAPTPERLTPLRSVAQEEALSQAAIDYAVRQMTARTTFVPVMTLPLSPQGGEEVSAKEEEQAEAPVQRAAHDGASVATSTTDSAASANVDQAIAGAGRSLDPGVRRVMETRFGHDFSSVRLHDDGGSAAAVDADAYTVGDHIVLGAGQDVTTSPRLLAHELAHVVQHDQSGGEPVVHRYTAFSRSEQEAGGALGWQHPVGENLRIADDGLMAVEDKGWGEATNKRAWTTPSLASDANAILASQGSQAELQAIPGAPPLRGNAPDGGDARELVQIEPHKPGGGKFKLASDCGNAARQVMGSGPKETNDGSVGAAVGGLLGLLAGGALGAGLGFLAGGPLGALIGGIIGGLGGLIGGVFAGRAVGRKSEPGTRDVAALSGEASSREEYLSPRSYHGGNPTTPEEWTEELLRRELGGDTREEAYRRYGALTDEERDAFDRRHGINKYAVPRVGQGQTISTEKDMPGFQAHPGMERATWNFHYAATVLVSGHDHVNIENAAGWDEYDGWIFYLYGPAAKGQSFHEEQAETLTHGTRQMSFVVQPEHSLDVTTTGASTTLRTTTGTVSLPVSTPLRIIERMPSTGGNEYLVRVTGGASIGTVGHVDSKDVR